MRRARRPIGVMLVLFGLAATLLPAQTARANHLWSTGERMTRNQIAVELGNEAHIIIQGWATVQLEAMGASEVRSEMHLPMAPKIDRDGAIKPYEYGGDADIVAFWGVWSERPTCEVYEIKTDKSYWYKRDVAQTQLRSYIDGINEDRNIPCAASRGLVWMPASYPNWVTVPDIYTGIWASKGIELRVTSRCMRDPSDCGIIRYEFRWKSDEDMRMARNQGARSSSVGRFMVETMLARRERLTTEEDQRRAIASLERLIAKYEVDEQADDDAWQELIDIRRWDDNTIDPWVTSQAVMDSINGIMLEQWINDTPRILLPMSRPGGSRGCPFQSIESRVKLCA